MNLLLIARDPFNEGIAKSETDSSEELFSPAHRDCTGYYREHQSNADIEVRTATRRPTPNPVMGLNSTFVSNGMWMT